MTFQMTDDMFTESERFRSLSGPPGIALVYVLDNILARHNTDGAVSPFHLEDALGRCKLAGRSAKAAQDELIKVGLLHSPETLRDCAECKERVSDHPKIKGKSLPEQWHYRHGFLRANLDKKTAKDPVARERNTRKRALHRNTELVALIRDRDGDLCRYCGVRVKWGNQVGERGGTYDHVYPDGGNEITNVVVSCKRCNSKLKGERTPEEAGMPLRPPQYPYGPKGQHQLIPDPLYVGLVPAQVQKLIGAWLPEGSFRTQPVLDPDPVGIESESNPDSVESEPEPIPLTRARATRDGSGPGSARAGSGLGPGSVPVQSGFNPEGTDGLPPDGSDPDNVRRLPTGGDVA